MARAARGRKAAKNEVAAALITALKFGSVLKTPTTTSIEQAHYAWLNNGQCVMYDGIVAAGYPIPEEVNGYPNAKLLVEALDNTDKSFTWTRHENGNIEVGSDKYSALVPALDYNRVIATIPDPIAKPVANGEGLLATFEAILKVTQESGDVVMYSSAKFTGHSVMGTNGSVMIEVREFNNLPPIIVPRQFVQAVVKAGMKPHAMGLGVDWKTFTIWFENGAWLRTTCYDSETWPVDALELFHKAWNNAPVVQDAIDAKVWAAVAAVLPFTSEDGRVVLRPGLIRTHASRHDGAAIEVKEATATFDVIGKQFLNLAELAKHYAINSADHAAPVMLVLGDNMRGLVAGMEPLPEADTPRNDDWGSGASPQGQGAGFQMVEPRPEQSGDSNAAGNWKNGPEPGTSDSAEFKSQYHDQDAADFYNETLAPFVVPDGQGFDLPGFTTVSQGFTASEWASNLTDEDAGLNSDNNGNNGGW